MNKTMQPGLQLLEDTGKIMRRCTTLKYQSLYLMPMYGESGKKLGNSELFNETVLKIPLHSNLSNKDLDFITSNIKESRFYKT
jgi:dTDP-4-amino-4,6-dideoxygalactose transaminase